MLASYYNICNFAALGHLSPFSEEPLIYSADAARAQK